MTMRKQHIIINPRAHVTVTDKLLRRCPKCDAGPGHRCGRMSSVLGWVYFDKPHKER